MSARTFTAIVQELAPAAAFEGFVWHGELYDCNGQIVTIIETNSKRKLKNWLRETAHKSGATELRYMVRIAF